MQKPQTNKKLCLKLFTPIQSFGFFFPNHTQFHLVYLDWQQLLTVSPLSAFYCLFVSLDAGKLALDFCACVCLLVSVILCLDTDKYSLCNITYYPYVIAFVNWVF